MPGDDKEMEKELKMKFIRRFNESQGEVLYREMEITEWRESEPKPPPSLPRYVTIHEMESGDKISMYRMNPGRATDPIPTAYVGDFLDMMITALGQDIESMEAVVSFPGKENEIYKVYGDESSITTPKHLKGVLSIKTPEYLKGVLKDGEMEAHQLTLMGQYDSISVLFMEDDWVAVRVKLTVMDIEDGWTDMDKAYKCDGINGARQCLEMITNLEK
jgi:hypothetical protein